MKHIYLLLLFVLIGILISPSPTIQAVSGDDSGIEGSGITTNDYYPIEDGYTEAFNAVYLTAWNAKSGTPSDTATTSIIRQRKIVTGYYVDRGFFIFNTSDLPDMNINITSAVLSVWVTSALGTCSFVIQHDSLNISPHNPIISWDYDKTNYSGDGGYLSVKAGTGRFNIPLNTTGKSWINKTGLTRLCVRNIKDINAVPPTVVDGWIVASIEDTNFLHKPYLSITYNFAGSTYVDAVVPYEQYNDTIPLTATGSSTLANVSLWYRYSNDNISWNTSYTNYTTGYDNHFLDTYESDADYYYQSFQVFNYNVSVDKTWWYLKAEGELPNSLSAVCYVSRYDASTGVPSYYDDYGIGYIAGVMDISKITLSEYNWVQFNFSSPVLVITGCQWCVILVVYDYDLLTSHGINIGYDDVDPGYLYGCANYFDGSTGFYVYDGNWGYGDKDVLFSVNGSWREANISGNPDYGYPWNWTFPNCGYNLSGGYQDGYYEFFSIGMYDGMNETFPWLADARYNYTMVPAVGFHVWLISVLASSSHVLSLFVCFGGFLFIGGSLWFLVWRSRRKKKSAEG